MGGLFADMHTMKGLTSWIRMHDSVHQTENEATGFIGIHKYSERRIKLNKQSFPINFFLETKHRILEETTNWFQIINHKQSRPYYNV